MYQGKQHILHIEFESGKNKRMDTHMLAYNAMLHLEHNLPVISIVIYLFDTQMVVSPFLMKGGDGIITTFHFRIIRCFISKQRNTSTNISSVCIHCLRRWRARTANS